MTKKVLFALHNLEGGGAEKMMVKIMNGFVKADIQVELLLGNKTGIHLKNLHSSIKVHEVKGLTLSSFLRSFLRILKKDSYTHIFTIGYFISSAALLAKKFSVTKTKIYCTHHFAYPAKRPFKYWKGDLLLKSYYFLLFPSADKIIAVSKGALEWLKKFSRRSLPQGIVIYNPAVDDSIQQKAIENCSLPFQTKDKKILLTIGRLSEEKDQINLLNAFDIYRSKYPSTLLFIIGEGPLEKKIKELITQLQLEKYVFLFGFQNNPYKWMATCDVFILSSKFEGFGNVLAEAMNLGKTIVSTDCPVGPSEILDSGKLGYLCPVADPTAMANAIEHAILYPINNKVLINASYKYHERIAIAQYLNALEN